MELQLDPKPLGSVAGFLGQFELDGAVSELPGIRLRLDKANASYFDWRHPVWRVEVPLRGRLMIPARGDAERIGVAFDDGMVREAKVGAPAEPSLRGRARHNLHGLISRGVRAVGEYADPAHNARSYNILMTIETMESLRRDG